MIHRQRASNGESGLSLIEVTLSLSIFAILVLSVVMTLASGIQHRQQTFQEYRALSALRDAVAAMQETANRPQNLAAKEGIGSVYNKYEALTISTSGLPSGVISIDCFSDENTLPSRFGGPQDLNLDGDARDNLGNASLGTDLKIVPVSLTVTYSDDKGTRTETIDRLITKTTE